MDRRTNYVFTLNDAYSYYKRATHHDIKNRLSLPKFKEVFKTFFEELIVNHLDKGEKVVLPFSLGTIYAMKEKKVVRYLYKEGIFDNDRTGGFVYRLICRSTKLKFAWAYAVKATTSLRQLLYRRIVHFADQDKYYPSHKIS